MNICTPELFGWCDSTWKILDQSGILLGLILMFFSIFGLFLAIIAIFRRRRGVNRIYLWLRARMFPTPKAGEIDDDWGWDGIVFTVSRANLPKWVIDTHHPDLKGVALIATQQSRQEAEQIEQHAKTREIEHVFIEMIPDHLDINDVQNHTELAVRKLMDKGIANPAIDVTGGTVTMSLGSYKAAVATNTDTLYIASVVS